ncbi:MAG: hypothetical protein HY909_21795 [Deltaproteobacteria bacterium]|nr:hypothetical protein [Deltaproteobacteria bacterium]
MAHPSRSPELALDFSVAGQRSARRVGQLLDALVRSSRVQGEAPRGAQERTLEAWREAGLGTLVLEPTTLWVNNEVALGGPEAEVRWLLLAFMAGLRAITPDPEVTTDELQALAAELSALEPTCASIERFRDWLWADGAQGFTCDLQVSFMEALEGVIPDGAVLEPAAEDPAQRPAAVAVCTEEVYGLACHDLASASGRAELSVVLDAADPEAPAEPCLGDALRRELAGLCDDPSAWVLAETRAALSHPPLGATRALRQRGEALRRALSGKVDLAVLEGLASNGRHNDPTARRLLAFLDDEELAGRAAAALLDAHAGPTRLSGLLVGTGPVFARAFLRSLLDRGALDDDTATRLASSLGLQRFFDLLNLSGLDLDAAAGLLRLLEAMEAPDDAWARLLDALDPAVAVALLPSLPSRCLRAQAAPLVKVCARLDPGALGAHLLPLVESQGPHAVRFLGLLLRACHGRHWPSATLRAVLQLLVDAGAGSQALVPLVHSREVDPHTRVLVLRYLEQDREALLEALQRRVSEFLDPQEVRDRLQSLRRSHGVGP